MTVCVKTYRGGQLRVLKSKTGCGVWCVKVQYCVGKVSGV